MNYQPYKGEQSDAARHYTILGIAYIIHTFLNSWKV